MTSKSNLENKIETSRVKITLPCLDNQTICVRITQKIVKNNNVVPISSANGISYLNSTYKEKNLKYYKDKI